MPRYFFTSLTRISNLREIDFQVAPMSREHWATGDYVVGEVNARPSQVSRVELSTGRTIEVMEGSLIVGAFGKRHATLEVVGDWRAIGNDLEMEILGTGGVLGKLTSKSPLLPPRISLTYRGHAVLDGQKICMGDFTPKATNHKFKLPAVLITGTSMSAGKTTTARVLIRILKESNLKVLGVKLAGSGHYRDILGMRDAGADHIFDFVDVGLPTTVCSEEEYRKAIKLLLSHIAQVKADIAVLEIGASPMEPYNGALAVSEIEDLVVFSILCASDPYSVVGMIKAYGKKPDLVAGVATSTEAGTELIESISGIRALNLLDREAQWKLQEMLKQQVPIFTKNN